MDLDILQHLCFPLCCLCHLQLTMKLKPIHNLPQPLFLLQALAACLVVCCQAMLWAVLVHHLWPHQACPDECWQVDMTSVNGNLSFSAKCWRTMAVLVESVFLILKWGYVHCHHYHYHIFLCQQKILSGIFHHCLLIHHLTLNLWIGIKDGVMWWIAQVLQFSHLYSSFLTPVLLFSHIQ